jgi:hypothetical protein
MWPKSAGSLSYRLSEVKPSLRELGIEIYDTQHSRTRLKTLHIYQSKKVCITSSASSGSLEPTPLEGVERKYAPNENDLCKNANDLQNQTSLANTQTSLANQEPAEHEIHHSEGQNSHANDAKDTNAVLHTSSNWSIDEVQIVNIHMTRCDFYGGRKWHKKYGFIPLAGTSGYLGNPFVIERDGNREEVLTKYENWLYHGAEVVNARDPVEYRRTALEQDTYDRYADVQETLEYSNIALNILMDNEIYYVGLASR